MTELDRLSGRCRLLAETSKLLDPDYLERGRVERFQAKVHRLANAQARHDAEMRAILEED